jgi:hypothetical protein
LNAVFTIAIGNPLYIRMACALARSFRLWHGNGRTAFYLITDTAPDGLPRDLGWVNIIAVRAGEIGRGFASKLYLDRLAPAPHSLFVDADCLCVGSLDEAFRTFAGHAVSVIGRPIQEGNWFGNVRTACRRLGIAAMPRFNGGVYYLEPGEMCTRVFESARELAPRYADLGFQALRGQANDEVLVSAAMALHGQAPVPETGDIMNSLLAGPAGLEIDVFAGRALLKNSRQHPAHNPWYNLEEMRPRLVHFLGSNLETYPYRQEEWQLDLVCRGGWPRWLAKAWVRLAFSWPWLIRQKIKDVLRPAFHRFCGPRAIISDRMP